MVEVDAEIAGFAVVGGGLDGRRIGDEAATAGAANGAEASPASVRSGCCCVVVSRVRVFFGAGNMDSRSVGAAGTDEEAGEAKEKNDAGGGTYAEGDEALDDSCGSVRCRFLMILLST